VLFSQGRHRKTKNRREEAAYDPSRVNVTLRIKIMDCTSRYTGEGLHGGTRARRRGGAGAPGRGGFAFRGRRGVGAWCRTVVRVWLW